MDSERRLIMMQGIKLNSQKEASLVSWMIKRPKPPEEVFIPLTVDGIHYAKPIIHPRQDVEIGQPIAAPVTPEGVMLHAGIAGRFEGVVKRPHPLWGVVDAAHIRADGSDKKFGNVGLERSDWESLTREETLRILKDMGVIGLKSMTPVHIKNEPRRYGNVHTLIINACESEPYVTSEHALMMSAPVEILKGAEILRDLVGAERVVVAMQDNNLEVAEILKSKIYFLKWNHFEIQILPSIYPQDEKKLLLRKIFHLKPDEINPEIAEAFQMHHVATAFAVYEAVALQKPLYERAVTVGGECVVEARNVWAPIGTTLNETFKFCRGLLRDPRKMIMGGAMRGQACSDAALPIIQSTDALLALPKEVAKDEDISPCIRCNECVNACPVDISPVMITLAAEMDEIQIASEWGTSECIECGNCSYVCPAKRPMVDLIRYADTKIREQNELQEMRQHLRQVSQVTKNPLKKSEQLVDKY